MEHSSKQQQLGLMGHQTRLRKNSWGQICVEVDSKSMPNTVKIESNFSQVVIGINGRVTNQTKLGALFKNCKELLATPLRKITIFKVFKNTS